MREVKIVFTKSRKKFPIASWLIRLWTWKEYSHVALEVNLSWLDGPMYFQASDGKVNYEYKTHFDRKHEIVQKYTISIPEDLYGKLSKKRLELAGEEYGFLQNLGILYVDIMAMFKKSVKNPWKKGENCSELLYKTVLKPMYPDLNYDPDTIRPDHIEDIIMEKCYGQKKS